ncbi:carnitine acyl carnitine carrier [Pisolithus albus]|nr:carnitine acyl carnitine carrier [Pisolithus albus]
MRLWRYLAISLWFAVCGASSSHLPWHASLADQPRTLVDILNRDEDYSLLLSLLQRARLIPTLNKLNGSTLFAPTNDAIKRRSGKDSLLQRALEGDELEVPDNVQEELRQQFFYHLLNYTIPVPGEEPTTQTLKTLHFPRRAISPPTREPPPFPPWLPIPEGTLGGEPQRLRLTSRDDTLWVGTNAFGQGGVEVVKSRTNASNGVVYGISDMLQVPPSLEDFLNETSCLSLFMPVDAAWESIDPLERLYLESEFSDDDRRRVLGMHSVVEENVKWSESFASSTKMTTEYGSVLDVEISSKGATINGTKVVQPDVYASNGVLHLVSTFLIPPGALQLTPEKYLLTLNCTSFVSLLRSVNLTHLINNSDHRYTILAPKDDVLSFFANDGLPKAGSEDLKQLLQYHFIPGIWTPKKLDHGALLETELREPGLDDGRQVLQVEVHNGEKSAADSKHISFGGAGVIGDYVDLNNTIIYFISRPLEPPVDPLQAALPSLDLSSFLAAVFSTSLADVIKKTPRTTFLIPRNSAFKRLGRLVSDHLLAASSKADLENVILHHVIDSVRYSKSLVNESQRTFPTLEGSDLQLERTDNGSVFIRASGGWADMQSALYPQNLLTKTGVVHEVSDLMIPRTVELNVGKLMKAAKATTMASMITKAGFDWVLNGTAPPGDSEWAVLCPTDDAFKEFNLTELLGNQEVLRSVVSQHLIPTSFSGSGAAEPNNNNRPLPLYDLGTYSTLLSPSSAYGDIVFRTLEDKSESEYMVGIKGARGTDGKTDWARVLSWGRTTTGSGTGGVIQVDRLLLPYHPRWWIEYGPPSFVGAIGGTEAQSPEDNKNLAAENVKSFIAGGFGGVCAVLVGHPFDLTKTRLQTAAAGQYTGAIDVVRKTLARDGVTGMYRGIVPPLLGVTPIFAMSFWAYDASKTLIYALTPNRTSETLSTLELATAGFLSAVPTTLVTAPVERAKVVLQVQGQGTSSTQYKGVVDVMRHLYREGGMRSIFRGTGATLARDGPGSAAYFAAYEVTKKFLISKESTSDDLNLGAIIFAGGTAGVAMWSLAIPPDVLKSRLQSAPTGTYSGLFDCFRKTVAQDGITALWKGFGPAMARAFPANAATFLGVEASRKLLDSLF